MTDPILTATVATIAATTVASAVKSAHGPAQFIDDVMEIVGFGMLTQFADKMRSKREVSLANFKKEIAIEINKVNRENIQEPKLSIVGPALDASKYYINEKIIRDMFSKLIASSIDSSKNSVVHQSFVEIIKQLDEVDAKHLLQIVNNKYNPIVSFNYAIKNGKGSVTVKKDLFISDILSEDKHNLVSSSLINLQRLGLIGILRDKYYTDEESYNSLLNSEIKKIFESKMPKDKNFKITKGIIELTSLGESFCIVCL